MKNITILTLAVLFSLNLCAQKKSTKTAPTQKTIESFTAKMERHEGFFTYFMDHKTGKLFLEIPEFNLEFLYVNALAAGVGSNDIGLDRGQLGRERVVYFDRRGAKVLLVQPNYDYRAVSDNIDEVKSVREAFASSVLWGFKVEATTGKTVLIELTNFLLNDSHAIVQRLKKTKQGTYKLDASRSALYKEGTINFPQNTEFESILTFTGDSSGSWVRSVVPTPESITVRTHHSFIKLPDAQYKPRRFDPRSGFNDLAYLDYATPIESSIKKRLIVRHRLEKKEINATISEPVEPIIYYLDRGAPEPVRSALLEGARWWNEAFEAAGFRNAFKVEILPEGVHPLDVRYNVIQWVHRSTRGWSYGSSVVDPRTGEIIKGHVSLGSLRVRQDFLIAQGLLNQYDEGTQPLMDMALARIRQLAAHEVGHTLGLAHNYASSTNHRASVMDYPHPLVNLDENGKIDLSDAYDTHIGEWDKVSITYGYAQFDSNQDEQTALNNILEKAISEGLQFISDRDARAAAGAHPTAHLWDNGVSASEELKRMLSIRRVALDQLSDASLPTGEPYSSIEEILVPMYLFHRYQVEATAKVVGGLHYTYAVKGDQQIQTALISNEEQMKALDAIIETITPEALELNEDLLRLIPPKAKGYDRNRETFESHTGPVWDYYTAIETATQFPLMFLLQVDRMNRLVMYHDRDVKQPGLSHIIDKLLERTWKSPSSNPSRRAIQRIVEWVMLEHLMMVGHHREAQPDTRSIMAWKLDELKQYYQADKPKNETEKAHHYRVIAAIEKWQKDPEKYHYSKPQKAPDGSPIGHGHWNVFCSQYD